MVAATKMALMASKGALDLGSGTPTQSTIAPSTPLASKQAVDAAEHFRTNIRAKWAKFGIKLHRPRSTSCCCYRRCYCCFAAACTPVCLPACLLLLLLLLLMLLLMLLTAATALPLP